MEIEPSSRKKGRSKGWKGERDERGREESSWLVAVKVVEVVCVCVVVVVKEERRGKRKGRRRREKS